VIKRQFGYLKTRYRGLAKNRAQLFTLFALGNLFLSDGGCWHEAESVRNRPGRRPGGQNSAKIAHLLPDHGIVTHHGDDGRSVWQ
jgi:hypothetical protein